MTATSAVGVWTEGVREIATRVAHDSIPVYVARMHWKRRDEITDDDLACFDREMRIAEQRCFRELAGYESEALRTAVRYPEDGRLRGAEFLIDRVTEHPPRR